MLRGLRRAQCVVVAVLVRNNTNSMCTAAAESPNACGSPQQEQGCAHPRCLRVPVAPATSTATRNPSRSYPRPMMQRMSRRARCIGPLHALPSSQPPPSPRRAKPRPNKYSVSQATFLQRQQSQETDRARSIHSQRSTGGSAPVESISSAAERQQAVSRPPFCSR